MSINSTEKKRKFIYKGEEYTSYYQLEKVMKLSRRTIQYRHETKGIPIDEILNFIPSSPVERLGKKVYFPTRKDEKKQNDYQRIIDYPKAPQFKLRDDLGDFGVLKDDYILWLEDAPEALLKRELQIYSSDLVVMNDLENAEYFYETATYQSEKMLLIEQIRAIKSVIEDRKLNSH